MAQQISTPEMLSLLTSTLARAYDYPGKVADARDLARRLAEIRDDLRVDLARKECDATAARRLGRDFSVRKAEIAADSIREEIVDMTAMVAELEHVARRLRRERRVLMHRIETLAGLAEELPRGSERSHVVSLLARARACLSTSFEAGEPEPAKPSAAVYTFIRGETKHSGQAR